MSRFPALKDIQTRGFGMILLYIVRVMGGVPETPKDPPRNFPAGASPSPDWQRCLFSFLTMRSSSNSRIPDIHPGNAGASPAGRTIFQVFTTRRASACAARFPNPCGSGAAPGRRANFPHHQRSSQVARQRFHTPRIAGSNPASATTF